MIAMRNAFVLVLALIVCGCGERVEVPPAHVGKILTRNGYAPDTIPPSKFRLEPCFAYCDRLVLLEAADSGFGETLTIFLPKEEINIAVEVRGTLSIPTDDAYVNAIYSRVTASDDQGEMISSKKVYETYGAQALRGIVRSELVKYDIAQLMGQREAIGASIHAAIQDKMSKTKVPLIVSRFELADIQPPKVIIDAQLAARKRAIDIQQAEADAQVRMVEAERALEVAKADRLVEREKAEAIAEQNRIAADSITVQVLAYKRLEVAERIYTNLAQSDNVIIVPADSDGFSSITDDAVLARMIGREIKQ